MEDFQTILTFVGFLALFAAITLFLGMRERKRTREKLQKKLRAGFGQKPAKKTSPERYAQIPQYHLHHPEGFRIDDITWNDLDLDRVFSQMDNTCSAAGEEYLYDLLRAPALREEDLPFSQTQYDYFRGKKHEEERVRLQEILTGLGHAGRYSLYDYIDFTLALGERNNLPHYIACAAPFLAFAVMFRHTGIGMLVLLLVFAINLRTYFTEKGKIAPYYQVFTYILRLLDCAKALHRENCPVFSEETEEIPALLRDFEAFRRGSGLLLGSTAGSADPLGIALEYLRILFHLDLIKFNSMLGQMRGRQEQIDALLTIAGRIDACISIASWADTLPHCCEPDLMPSGNHFQDPTASGDTIEHPVRESSGAEAQAPDHRGCERCFDVAELFHPLLDHPVCNSLRAERPVLLTGSNASGKSTFLKSAALCALLSQAVGIAPARRYRGAYYRIYTSMALRDSLQDGESYFIVEIKSLRRILEASDSRLDHEADNPVLCCIDEVLRGTNTVERIAASAEILRCFAGTGTVCFAATHDLELTGLLSDVYDNLHFGEEIVDGDVRFSYRLLDGPSTSCNAIALLASLGYDPSLVRKARGRADRFLSEGAWTR